MLPSALLSRQVLRNAAALLVLQIGNYVLPLLLVPYLLRVLGLGLFGEWMFALAFVVIVRTFVSYGFDLTATRSVAVSSGSSVVLSGLMSSVTTARAGIWLLCFGILYVASLAVGEMQDVWPLIAIAMFILLGEILFPVWLFQGMERMGAITWIRLGSKVANLLLVVYLVKTPQDILLVPLIEALTSIAGGACAFLIALRWFKLVPARPHLSAVIAQLREGWHTFVAVASTQLYTTLHLVVLGFITGSTAVAHYSIAEKVYSALRGLLGPFLQAVFPSLAHLHQNDRSAFAMAFGTGLRILLPVLVVVGAMLFLAAPWIVLILSGQEAPDAVVTLRVFALSFPFALGGFLTSALIVRGASKALMRVTVLGGFIGVAMIFPLAHHYGAAGAAGAFLVVQIYNAVALLRANQKVDRPARSAP